MKGIKEAMSHITKYSWHIITWSECLCKEKEKKKHQEISCIEKDQIIQPPPPCTITTFFSLKSHQKVNYNNYNSCAAYTTGSPQKSKWANSCFMWFQKKLEDPGQVHNTKNCRLAIFLCFVPHKISFVNINDRLCPLSHNAMHAYDSNIYFI